MDPLTQGVIGTVAAQQVSKPNTLAWASLFGCLSGMAPDLDIFIRSSTDPLLALEYHRQFTHSLFFIPFGSLLCAGVFFVLFRKQLQRVALGFPILYLFCLLGYATHGLLDACTTYGTQLFWPLSDRRVAWNTISIIDPLFTLPLLVLTILAICRRSRRYCVAALCWVIIYSSLGMIQRERAEAFAWQLAKQRGHQPIKLEAKPSFANILVWKVIYITEDAFYIDGVRVVASTMHYSGSAVSRLNLKRDFPWLDANSQQAKDLERFRWFSNGYIARSPLYSKRIIDVRYSLLPNQIRGLWGIELREDAKHDEHIRYITDHSRDNQTFKVLWAMILGKTETQ